ncbi:MAG: leucine-rich repeat domain-containing protein, partial [Oscillospiraceae bacterium]|nr:leucine-rich repeat domain-containing protein [Oscillospiraceae bacterium]
MKRTKHIIALTMAILLTAAPILSPVTSASVSVMTATAYGDADDFDYINCGDHIEITWYKKTKYVVEIPEEIEGLPVTKIAPGAFRGDNDIRDLYLPATIEEIGDEALACCCELLYVSFRSDHDKYGATPKRIGNNAFCGCQKLAAIYLPDGIEEIGSAAFAGSGVHHVILPETLRTISAGAFAYCENLDTIMIPAGVEHIDHDAFTGSTGLQTVCYKGSAAQWDTIAINGGNEALLHAKRICDYNKQQVERAYTFDPARDAWSFTNKEVEYYVMSDERLAELTAEMSNTERAAAYSFWKTTKDKYMGCCAGITDTALLAAAGILDPAALDPDAACLHDVKLTDEVRELLTCHLILENSYMPYEHDIWTDDEVFYYLDIGSPLYIGYSGGIP